MRDGIEANKEIKQKIDMAKRGQTMCISPVRNRRNQTCPKFGYFHETLESVHFPMVLTMQKPKMMMILLCEFIRCRASAFENEPQRRSFTLMRQPCCVRLLVLKCSILHCHVKYLHK